MRSSPYQPLGPLRVGDWIWSVTWYWNRRLAKMVSTNWQLHGKGHTSSRLLHDLPRTDLQDLTALTCLTPFISTNLGVFTPNSQLHICIFFYTLYIYIHTCLHCWSYNYNTFLRQQYTDHQSLQVLGAALSSTLLITCTRSVLCILGGRQTPFGQTSCTLTCIQAMTALHSDHWPLQSRTDLQDDVVYAWTTKNRTFRCSNLVLVDYTWTTKNRTFRGSNLVLVDYGWTTKNRTFYCSNLVLVDYA
jgi:hypothetical protein